MTEELSARITMLDGQLVDSDGIPFGRVDDLELKLPDRGAPRVEVVLTGSQALGERIGGAIGQLMASVSSRMRKPSSRKGPTRIDSKLIEEVEPMVRLSVSLEELPDVAALERWLTENVIEGVPGVRNEDL
jgi:hypothetical protein